MLSELRKDPFSGQWSIIAAKRSKRPQHLAAVHSQDAHTECPFCPGQEHLTPPAVHVWPEGARSREWKVRVVPNRFPVLGESFPVQVLCTHPWVIWSGSGHHEVLVESPHHVASLGHYSLGQGEMVLRAIQRQMSVLSECPGVSYVQTFKNHGVAAGASLAHPHFQLIGLPMTPATVERELDVAKEYWHLHGECVYCSIMAEEIQCDERVVELSADYALICPVASRFPYQLHLQPRSHAANFLTLDGRRLQQLALALSRAVHRLEQVVGPQVPYNLILHTQPSGHDHCLYYHWHWEIIPRLATPAGLEAGSGLFVNSLPPEEACRLLVGANLEGKEPPGG